MKAEIKSNDPKKYYKNEFNKGYYNELRDKIIYLIKEAVPITEIIKDFSLKNVDNKIAIFEKK